MLTIYNVFEAENAVDATLPSFPRGIWTTDYLIPRVMLYQSPSKNLLAIFYAHMWHAICMLLHQSSITV